MKQSPDLNLVERDMQPGVITLDGFLGSDRRSLAEILDEDDNAVRRLGLTHGQIADRLEHFTQAAMKGLGMPVVVDEVYEVHVDSVRGVLPCPWRHAGVYPKSNAFLKNLETGETLAWTELSVHLIRAHGFYQGRGNPFRIEPAGAKQVLRV